MQANRGFEVRSFDGRVLLDTYESSADAGGALHGYLSSHAQVEPFVLRSREPLAEDRKARITDLVLAAVSDGQPSWFSAEEEQHWFGPRVVIDDGLRPAFAIEDSDAGDLYAAVWANGQTLLLLHLDSPWGMRRDAGNPAKECWYSFGHAHPDHGRCADSLHLMEGDVLLTTRLEGEETSYFHLAPCPTEPEEIASTVATSIKEVQLFGAEVHLLALWALGFPYHDPSDPWPIWLLGIEKNLGYEVLHMEINPPAVAAGILKRQHEPDALARKGLLDVVVSAMEAEGDVWSDFHADWAELIRVLQHG